MESNSTNNNNKTNDTIIKGVLIADDAVTSVLRNRLTDNKLPEKEETEYYYY